MTDDGGRGVPPARGSDFGAVLRELRLSAGLTQEELARRAGMGVGSVRDLEQGRRVRPRAPSIARLTHAMGLDPAQSRRLARAGGLDSAQTMRQPGGKTGPGTGLWVQVLGPVMAWRDGQPLALGSVRQRAVLALLALAGGRSLRREALVDALWPEGPPASAVNIVQGHVSRLRQLLSGGRMTAERGGVVAWSGESYQLRVGAGELDVLAFDELARQAQAAAEAGEDAQACALFEQALDLWRGEPAADTGVVTGHPVVREMSARWADVVVEYARVACGHGWHDRGLAHLRALTGREPLDERAHAWLMVALAGSGQQAAALEVFQACRRRLDEQLGVYPGPELSQAHQLVLRQEDPSLPRGEGTEPLSREPLPRGPLSREPLSREPLPREPLSREPLSREPLSREPLPRVPRQLPAGTAGFVGRAAELAVLAGLLDKTDSRGGTVVISAIGGIAGVGKTALALRWAHQVADRFPDGQLYVNLRGFGPGGPPMTPEAVTRRFLDALEVPSASLPPQPEAQTDLYRSLVADKQMLIVLDNARDSEQVIPLLPGSPGCLVLVTSRSLLGGLSVAAGARLIPVDVLTPGEARDLLAARLGRDGVSAAPAAVAEIVTLAGRLPLALSIVAARAAAHPAHRLDALAAELRDEHQRLDALGSGEISADVRAAFSWSYQQLSDAAGRMFRLLGLHPGPEISIPAAASLAAVSRTQARQALAELTAAGLLSEPSAGRFACHDLVRVYAAELARKCGSDEAGEAAMHRMLGHYLHSACAARLLIQPLAFPLEPVPVLPGVRPEEPGDLEHAMAWFAVERPVLLSVLGAAVRSHFDRYALQLPLAMSLYLQLTGQWQEWIDTLHASLAAARRLGDLAGQGWAHRFIGQALVQRGEPDEAAEHLHEALRFFTLVGDHTGAGSTHSAMAAQLDEQQRLDEAVDHGRQALVAYRLIGDKTGQAMALNVMGWVLTKLGDHGQAIDCCQQALDLCAEIGNRVVAMSTKDSLGTAYHNDGQYAQALACYQQAIAEGRELGDRWIEAEALSHLGDTHHARGDDSSAAAAWGQALVILEELCHGDADNVRAKIRQLDQAGLRAR